MSMSFVRRSSKLLVSVAVLYSIGSMAAEAATLVPTGGTMSGMSPSAVIPAAYGSFSGSREGAILEDNWPLPPGYVTRTMAEVAGSVTPDTLSIGGTGHSYIDATFFDVVSGDATGTIGFDLTESALTRFSLTQITGTFTNVVPGLSIVLRDSAGSILLGCIGSANYYSVSGGCRQGSLPLPADQGSDLAHEGSMQLAAGHYELSYMASGAALAGNAVDTQFDFKLTTVPLPASAWLLVSGLGLLARRRRAAEAV